MPVDGWAPRWLSPVSAQELADGDGREIAEFIEAFCTITEDTIAGRTGQPLVLRGWQHQLLDHLFARRADGRRKHRTALIGMARKNGKSALGAGIALHGLFCSGDGAQVFSCAADRDQARIVFRTARRMVEANEELSEATKLYRDAIEVPATGAVYRCLSAEAYTKEGLNPNLVLFDEVHAQPTEDLWNVMTLGSGARVDPLVLGITTAGARVDSQGRDTICLRLYEHGKRIARGEEPDGSMFFAWWEPAAGAEADHRDESVWREGNPGYGDLNDPDDFRSTLAGTSEVEFRIKRTNVWVAGVNSALPFGRWDAVAAPSREDTKDDPFVLVCDGSWRGDATALIKVSVSEKPHVSVVECWERPEHDDGSWRVPISDVEARIAVEAKNGDCREVALDPYRWQRSIDALTSDGVPVVEFPNTVDRMVKAWSEFYDAVLDKTMTHDGDPRLSRHIENMVLKIDAKGARPTKEHKQSSRHIDLGITAVIGVGRARWHFTNEGDDLEPWGFYA